MVGLKSICIRLARLTSISIERCHDMRSLCAESWKMVSGWYLYLGNASGAVKEGGAYSLNRLVLVRLTYRELRVCI